MKKSIKKLHFEKQTISKLSLSSIVGGTGNFTGDYTCRCGSSPNNCHTN